MSYNKSRVLPHGRQQNVREFRLGNYLIVTNGETEELYFTGLRELLRKEEREHLRIEVVDAPNADQLIKKADKCRSNGRYSEVWLVFDKDKEPRFDDIIIGACEKNMNVAWSNICFEVWLLALLGVSKLVFPNAQACCDRFKHVYRITTNQRFEDDYKTQKDLCRKVHRCGDLAKATRTCKNRHMQGCRNQKAPSDQNGVTTVYQLMEKIKPYLQQ